MKVEGNQLIIHTPYHPRQGWDDCFAAMANQGDDHLMDDISTTQWDEEEWKMFSE